MPDDFEKPIKHEGPRPLLRKKPKGRRYPVEALGPLRAAVEAAQAVTQAPVAIAAQSALAVASLAVQPFVDVETFGGPRPTSLFLVTLAKSGERKSSCDDLLMRAVREYERASLKSARAARAEWDVDHEIWKAEYDRLLAEAKTGETKRHTVEAELKKLGAGPLPPPSPERLASEPTFEGLTRLLDECMPSVGVFSDEGGQFLGGHAMNKDNRQKTVTAFNGLWDGKPIRRTRGGDGNKTLLGRRVAVHFMVQPALADLLMSDGIARDSGFLPRILVCEPPSTIGTRIISGIRPDTKPLDAFTEQVLELLERALPMDPETKELRPRVLVLSEGARRLLEDYANRIERAQAKGAALAELTGTASKSAEQAARIAGVLRAFQDPDAEEVSAEDMQNGIKLAEYYLNEALRLSQVATVSERVQNAEALRNWLLEKWEDEHVLIADILQRGPSPLRETSHARNAVKALVDHGWLVPCERGTIVRDKARNEAYLVVRSEDDIAGSAY